jgi:enediyne biosynthesis protein E4
MIAVFHQIPGFPQSSRGGSAAMWLVAMMAAGGCHQASDIASEPLVTEWVTPHVDRPAADSARQGNQPPSDTEPLDTEPPCDILLTDVTDRAGVSFVHDDGGSGGEKYIVEAVSAGLALFDFDGDGLIDLYFLSGAPLPPAEEHSRRNALYRNNGDGTFTDVTDAAGVGDSGFGLGVAVADIDNSGFPDIYINNFGPNVLYRNNGDGTFTEVTAAAGVGCGDLVGAGAAFLDADADGAIDLYVSNYVDFGFHNHVRWTIDGFRCYPGPLDFEPVADVLYRNNGDGTFTDISRSSGIADVAGTGMGMVCGDFNGNGATDIFIANDMQPNFLFENDGTGRFTEVGLDRGVAYNFAGRINGNMGVDCGDFDNDGWLDLFSTSYINEMPVLYRNLGGVMFEDATQATGAGAGSLRHVNWGTGFVDFNNNGHRDLFIAQGALDQNVHLWNARTAFALSNTLLMNTGHGSFVDVSDRCGDGLRVVHSSRGTGFDDLTNNGRIDVVILNSRAPPTILQNETRNDHHWLQVQLRGVRTNRDGVGAQVRVTASGRTQMAEVHSGRGYQSHFGTRLHFGLGSADRVQRVEVRWIGGGRDVLEDVPADRLVSIIEGQERLP